MSNNYRYLSGFGILTILNVVVGLVFTASLLTVLISDLISVDFLSILEGNIVIFVVGGFLPLWLALAFCIGMVAIIAGYIRRKSAGVDHPQAARTIAVGFYNVGLSVSIIAGAILLFIWVALHVAI